MLIPWDATGWFPHMLQHKLKDIVKLTVDI